MPVCVHLSNHVLMFLSRSYVLMFLSNHMLMCAGSPRKPGKVDQTSDVQAWAPRLLQHEVRPKTNVPSVLHHPSHKTIISLQVKVFKTE